MSRWLGLLSGLLVAGNLHAATGRDAWLRYAPLEADVSRQSRESLPAVVVSLGDSAVLRNANQELIRGIRGMLGRTLRVEPAVPGESAVVMGTLAEIRKAAPHLAPAAALAAEGYCLKVVAANGMRYMVIAGADERGVLYGSFALLRKIAAGEPIRELDETQAPSASVRWLNLWDFVGAPQAAGRPAIADADRRRLRVVGERPVRGRT